MSLVILSSPRFTDHVMPPGHPESVERGEVFEGVALRARDRGIEVREPRPVTSDELRRVHTEAHLRRIEALRGQASMIDPDTFTSPDSVDVARLACGAAVEGVEVAMAGSRQRVLALVRPPGHHAEPGRAMGFCLFGNVAVGAAHALASGLERVAIVDIDVHHGNGTQASFYDDPRVLFVSTHQYPFYPGSGAVTDVGRDDGAGYTINAPLEAGATDGDYRSVMTDVILPVLQEFSPQLLMISAGFDAHEDDPLGQMRLTTSGYAGLIASLQGAADECCDGRVVVVTEGGYALPALSACCEAAVAILSGSRGSRQPAPERAATGRADRTCTAIRAAQAGRWHGL
jgi:acetoin utilization deacetylase AcuC-like enzyme